MTGSLADRFKSGSQKAGNVTEAWGAEKFSARIVPRPNWIGSSWEPRRTTTAVRIAAFQGLLASFDGVFGRSWEFAL